MSLRPTARLGNAPDDPSLAYDPDDFCARFLAPWNDRDVDAVMSWFVEEPIWEFTAGPEPWGTTYRGHDAVRGAVVALFEAVPDLHYEVVRRHATRNQIVVEVLVTGTTAQGERLRYQACDIMALDEGLVVGKSSYRKVVGA